MKKTCTINLRKINLVSEKSILDNQEGINNTIITKPTFDKIIL